MSLPEARATIRLEKNIKCVATPSNDSWVGTGVWFQGLGDSHTCHAQAIMTLVFEFNFLALFSYLFRIVV
jgi:hypothetical protein